MTHVHRLAVLLAALAAVLVAQSSALAEDDVTLVVHDGDDVEEMVARLTGGGATLDDIRKANGLDAGAAFTPGQQLHIPADLLVGIARSSAELLFYRGEVSALKADGTTLPMGVGIRLYSGDHLITGAGATASLRLAGHEDSLAHEHMVVQEHSDVEITQLLVQSESKDRNVILRLLRGALEIVTSHCAETQQNVDVETPTAIGGVRGTRFRVVVEEAEGVAAATRFESLENTVAVAASSVGLEVGAGYGSRARANQPPDALHPLPAAPSPSFPADGAQLEEFLFRWADQAGVKGYVLEIALDEEFHLMLTRILVPGTEHAPAETVLEVREAPYYWRISAIDDDGFQGLTSAPRSFHVQGP